MVAITAIHRLTAVRLERNLGIHAAASANSIIHLALGTIVTAAAATVATTASAAIAATATVTAATVLFCGIPAGFALFRGLKPFGLIKFLLFGGKGKTSATVDANEFGYGHDVRNLKNYLIYTIRFLDEARCHSE